MTCDNCAARVENALNSLEGIWASVRIDTGKARILSKETVDERKIREAVRGAGYGVGKLKT
jgi:copper chaperone CopZ